MLYSCKVFTLSLDLAAAASDIDTSVSYDNLTESYNITCSTDVYGAFAATWTKDQKLLSYPHTFSNNGIRSVTSIRITSDEIELSAMSEVTCCFRTTTNGENTSGSLCHLTIITGQFQGDRDGVTASNTTTVTGSDSTQTLAARTAIIYTGNDKNNMSWTSASNANDINNCLNFFLVIICTCAIIYEFLP